MESVGRGKPLSKRKRFTFVIISIGFSVLVACLLLETLLRIQASWNDKRNMEAFQRIKEVNTPQDFNGRIRWFHCIRGSQHPRIIYELIPDLSVKLMGRRFSTNSDGFRSPSYTGATEANTFRIIGLGDSMMFGWGVHDDETYLHVLDEKLTKTFPEVSWQVINTAVPGYNTVMEVETLKEKALKYKPDMVIIGFVNNDLSLPNFVRAKRNHFVLNKSYLMEALWSRMKRGPGNTGGVGLLMPATKGRHGKGFEHVPERVPAEYSDMVGLDAYQKAMEELKKLGRTHGFSILVFTRGDPPHYVKDVTSALDIPTLSAAPAIREYMRENHIKEYAGSIMAVSKKDRHPSAITHEIMADVLFEYIARHYRSDKASRMKPMLSRAFLLTS